MYILLYFQLVIAAIVAVCKEKQRKSQYMLQVWSHLHNKNKFYKINNKTTFERKVKKWRSPLWANNTLYMSCGRHCIVGWRCLLVQHYRSCLLVVHNHLTLWGASMTHMLLNTRHSITRGSFDNKAVWSGVVTNVCQLHR